MAATFLSINEFPGDGVTLEWDFNFAGGYVSTDHVKVLVRDEFGAPTNIPITAGNFISKFRIKLGAVVPSGHTLRIYRETPRDAPMVNFTGGSNFTEANLDILAKQVVFAAAEAFDAGAYAEVFDLLGQAQTAASQAAAARDASAASKSAAAASADAALVSKNAAELAKTNAETAKVNAELAQVNAESARDLALSYRDAAAGHASGASTSKAAAELAETNAELAETNAVSARDTATAKATAASGSATAAADSATAANASAVDAAASATAAATFDPANFTGRTGGGTGASDVPAGTTGERPVGASGRVRVNTTTGHIEFYVAGAWKDYSTVGLRAGGSATLNGASSVGITGLPAGIQRLTIAVSGMSASGAVAQILQLGTAGGVVTSGYAGAGSVTSASAVSTATYTNGAVVKNESAARILSGAFVLTRYSGNVWIITYQFGAHATADTCHGASIIDLGAELTQLQFILNGAGTFDGGAVTTTYELLGS